MAEEKPQSKSHQHTAAHLIAPIHPNTPKTKTAGSDISQQFYFILCSSVRINHPDMPCGQHQT